MNNFKKGAGAFQKKEVSSNQEDVGVNVLEVNEEEVIGKEQGQEAPIQKEETITMSVSELNALLDRKLEEKFKASQSQDQPKKQAESVVVTQIKNELFDDLPELRNFKPKERIYVLCDGSKPTSNGISSRHKDGSPLQYINKETNEVFALFYSLTQTSFFKEKHKGDSKVEHIRMKDGMLKTYENDIKLQKFLAIHPGNEAMGGSLFREYNPSKEAEVKIDTFELETKARNLAIELSYLKQDSIVRLLDENYKEDWTPSEVKTALYQLTLKSPTEFIKLANDKSLEVKGIAKVAVQRGILSYKNYRFYNENGDVICEVQRNQDEWEAIAEMFMTGEGRTTFEFIKNAIS